MTLLLQDVLVTAVALGALGMLIQRVVGIVRPAGGKSPGCSTCASCAPTATTTRAGADAGEHRQPVVFHH